MTHSMTAFTRQTREADWGSLQLEIRSVNQRHLEPHFRLPDALRDLEPPFRDALRQRLARGKVECTLRFEATASGSALTVNRARLATLASALNEVRSVIPDAPFPMPWPCSIIPAWSKPRAPTWKRSSMRPRRCSMPPSPT